MAAGYTPANGSLELDRVDPISDEFTILAQGGTPAWSTLQMFPPTKPNDLWITDVEITQALQTINWMETPMPLIQGKPTFVRVYVQAQVDTPGVTAVLSATKDGEQLGEPRNPVNPQIIVQADGSNRDNIYDSFYFRVPDEWLQAGVVLTVHIDPGNMIPESNEINNIFGPVIMPSLKQVEPLHILFVRVNQPTVPSPSFDDAQMAATWLKSAYPIEDFELHNWPFKVSVSCSLENRKCSGFLLWRLWLIDKLGSIPYPNPRVYGIVHQDLDIFQTGGKFGEGMISDCCAWGRIGSSEPSLPDKLNLDVAPRHLYGRVMGHEIGHTLGLPHFWNPISNDDHTSCIALGDPPIVEPV